MRIKLNSFLSVFVIIAVFFLSSCGGNGEQATSEQETPQAAQADSVPSAPVALADNERQRMYEILYSFLLILDGFAIDKGEGYFPATREEIETSYKSFNLSGGYDCTYETTDKNGKVENFAITIFNPAKTYRLDFDSSCYKDANCLTAWRNGYLNQNLDDSQIKPVTE